MTKASFFSSVQRDVQRKFAASISYASYLYALRTHANLFVDYSAILKLPVDEENVKDQNGNIINLSFKTAESRDKAVLWNE